MKKKNGQSNLIQILVYLGSGMLFGGVMMSVLPKSEGILDSIVNLVYMFIFIIVASMVQIIIHESGHYFFGRLTGYTLVSFRIGSRTWIRKDGVTEVKRFSMAGTGGQCLMDPPDNWETMPVKLYNLGGAIFNFASALLFYGLSTLFRTWIVKTLFMSLCLMGVIYGLVNGIPLSTNLINNDGMNLLEVLKSRDARRAFWCQLRIAALSARGYRLRDMPSELFNIDSDEKNSATINMIRIFKCNRLLDMGLVEEACQKMERLLSGEYAVPQLYVMMMENDLLAFDIMYGRTDKARERYRSTEALRRNMPEFPSVLRSVCLYEKHVSHDDRKYEESLETLKKIRDTYPNPQDIDSELELLAFVENGISSYNS